MAEFIKYPKTESIVDILAVKPQWTLSDEQWIIEEKMDGTQVGLSFHKGKPLIQSRGQFVNGEAQFSLFKQWLWQHHHAFLSVLGERYIIFGEWLYAKHTIFYDRLPHYFLEFDVYDRQNRHFLSTKSRQNLLSSLTFLYSVRVMQIKPRISVASATPLDYAVKSIASQTSLGVL